MTKDGISVIICTFNGAKVIEQTLLNLANQKVNECVSWEVLLIDNGSTDNTAVLAIEVWKNLNLPQPLRIVKENTPGKINALLTGIAEAAFEFLLICDDDNWLNENYVQIAYSTMASNHQIGVLGGIGIPEFESNKKPLWFDAYQGHFTVGKQSEKSGDISHKRGWVYGAGSVIRKTAVKDLSSYSFRSMIGFNRTKGKILRGEDIEMCYYILLKGYKVWYDERLTFQHFINNKRSDIEYLKKLFETGTHFSYLLDGMNYRAKANTGWYKHKYQRTWWFRFLKDSVDLKKVFTNKYLPASFLLKLHLLKVIGLIKLNYDYDRSFNQK